MIKDYSKIGDHDIVKPKAIVIQVKDDDGNIIDTIESHTFDYYELGYRELYNIIENIKEKFWKDLEG